MSFCEDNYDNLQKMIISSQESVNSSQKMEFSSQDSISVCQTATQDVNLSSQEEVLPGRKLVNATCKTPYYNKSSRLRQACKRYPQKVILRQRYKWILNREQVLLKREKAVSFREKAVSVREAAVLSREKVLLSYEAVFH